MAEGGGIIPGSTFTRAAGAEGAERFLLSSE